VKSLIVFSSKYGSTKECACILKDKLAGETDILNLDEKNEINLSNYENIILGAAIYAGKISKEMKKFLKNKKEDILKKNIYIFMLAGENSENYKKNYPREIMEKCTMFRYFGSELKLEEVALPLRLIIKYIIKGKNHKELKMENIEEMAKQIGDRH